MKEPKKRLRTLFVWLLLVVVFVVLFMVYDSSKARRFQAFEVFLRDLHEGRVAEVQVDSNRITVKLHGARSRYYTLGVLEPDLTAELSRQGVSIVQGQESGTWKSLLPLLLAVTVGVVVLLFFLRRNQGGVTDVLSLRKSRARLIPDAGKVTFADVAGCDEAKQLLGDVIDFLRNPQRWSQAGVRLPRGVLLEGPPGCGKTLLARAVAGETNARFYLSSASDFVEMFVGVGAARVRDMFDTARKNAPAVIFIDELDAVGRRRGSGIGSSHDEREQTLNQLLVCLDGLEGPEAVVVIAATNRPDILDSALLRPGRFDRRVRIPRLSPEARLAALRIHTRNKNVAPDVSLLAIVDRTDGWSGAQLESLANEAGLIAVRRARQADGQRPEVRMGDFEQAMRPACDRSRIFNKLDALLIESTTQLAEPTGKAVVRVVVRGESVEGELVWADSHFVKIRSSTAEILVPKAQIERMEALAGTECADPLDLSPDRWAGRPTDTV